MLLKEDDIALLHDRIESLTGRHIAKLMDILGGLTPLKTKKVIKTEFWRLKDDIVESFNQYMKGEVGEWQE